MDKLKLEKELDQCLDDYVKEVKFNVETFKGEFCTKDDMEELARQTFYCLNEFKKCLIKHLQ